MTIYFDMDGTLVDLYGVPAWLDKLQHEDPSPYESATLLYQLEPLAAAMQQLQLAGYKLGIISWLSKGGSSNYNVKVRNAKKKYLHDYLPITFNEIHIVKYGTNKYKVAKDKDGILFDDDTEVLKKWKGRKYNAKEVDLIKTLKELSSMAA